MFNILFFFEIMWNSKNILLQDFFIHFDLENNLHEIPIEQSIITEQSLKTIINWLNEKLFDNKLELKILVFPQENGSLLKKFWIWLVAGSSFIVWNMFPDVTNWIIMWLWDWRELKEYVRDEIIDFKVFVKWFLEKDSSILEASWMNHLDFYELYKAKNEFYSQALDNQNIRAIWFDNTQNFPIQKLDFFHKMVDLSLEKFSFDPIDRYHNVLIVSWINTYEDKYLVWQLKDKKVKRKFSAYMKDEEFNDFFLSKKIYLDNLTVKLRYYPKLNELWKISIEKREIIKVYNYNWERFSDFPDYAEISDAPLEVFEINGMTYTIRDEQKEEKEEKKKKEKNVENQMNFNF